MKDGRVPRLNLLDRYHEEIHPRSLVDLRRLLCWIYDEPLGVVEYVDHFHQKTPPPSDWPFRNILYILGHGPSLTAWDRQNQAMSGMLQAAFRLNFILPALLSLVWLLPSALQYKTVTDEIPYLGPFLIHLFLLTFYWVVLWISYRKKHLEAIVVGSGYSWFLVGFLLLLFHGLVPRFWQTEDQLQQLISAATMGAAGGFIYGGGLSIWLALRRAANPLYWRHCVYGSAIWLVVGLFFYGLAGQQDTVIALAATGTVMLWLWLLRPFRIPGLCSRKGFPKAAADLARFSFASPLPNRALQKTLEGWLQDDWSIGFRNLIQVWQITAQEPALLQALAGTTGTQKGLLLVLYAAQIAGSSPHGLRDRQYSAWVLRCLFAAPTAGLASWRSWGLFAGFMGWPRLRPPDPLPEDEARLTFGIFFFLSQQDPESARRLLRLFPFRSEYDELRHAVDLLVSLKNAKLATVFGKLQIDRPALPLLTADLWNTLAMFQKSAYFVRLRHLTPPTATAERDDFYTQAEQTLHQIVRRGRSTGPVYTDRLIHDLVFSWLRKLADHQGYEPCRPQANPLQLRVNLSSDLLVGRTKQRKMLDLSWRAEQMRPVRIFGMPGKGKSALITLLGKHFAGTLTVISVDMAALLEPASGTTQVGVEAVASHIARNIQDQTNIPHPPSFYGDPLGILADYLQRVAEQQNPPKVALCLDNSECLYDWSNRHLLPGAFFDRFRYVLAGLPGVGVAFIDGEGADLPACLVSFEGELLPLPLGNLCCAEVNELLERLGLQLPVYIDDDARCDIHAYTDGWPSLVGFLAYRAINDFNARCHFPPATGTLPLVSAEDVDRIMQETETIQHATLVCKPILTDLEARLPSSQIVLHEMARINRPQIDLSTLRSRLANRSPYISNQTLQDTLQFLEDHELISHKKSTYTFRSELFRRFLVHYL